MAGNVIVSEELASKSAAPHVVRGGMLSPGMKAGPFVYVSGAAASDLSLDFRGQTEQIYEYISLVLKEVGYDLSDVVKLSAFFLRAEDFPVYNEIRTRIFPQVPPASTTVVADFLFPGMLVEIDCVAYKE